MMHTVTEIRAEYDRLDRICGVNTRSIPIRISTRASRRLGCFSFSPLKPPEIMISAAVMNDDALFLNTIRHEYAHAVVYLRHPLERHGHDAVWKAVCREVGCIPKGTVQLNEQQREEKRMQAKYIIRCRHCGNEALYQREGKMVTLMKTGRGRRLSCGKCGSSDLVLLVRT